MKLYLLKNGVNPRRVRIFLAEKGVTVPTVEFDMETQGHRQPDFLAKNPMGTLPVLELGDGTVIAESVAICRYFEETYPDPPLMGLGAVGQATVEMWNRRMEQEIMQPAVDVFVHTHPFWVGRRTQVAAYGELRRQHLAERMAWLDRELAEREFIAGDRYGIADITAHVGLLLARGALQIGIDASQKNLGRWWSAMSARPAARA
jgi:glutathione S-transferase